MLVLALLLRVIGGQKDGGGNVHHQKKNLDASPPLAAPSKQHTHSPSTCPQPRPTDETPASRHIRLSSAVLVWGIHCNWTDD